MASSTTAEFRKGFVARLKQACDESNVVPPPHRGRQQYIADKLGVVPEAVSKRFKGVAMPRPDKLERLAELLQVDQSWLAFGISPEMNRNERKAHARTIDGAVHLAIGYFILSGGHCGMPSKTDPRRTYVDFYVTVRGSVHPIHVCMARELSRDHYEVIIPKEFEDVRCITLLITSPGKFVFLDMPHAMIVEHRTRKTGDYAVAINRVDGSRFITGGDAWPVLKNFAEFH